jgi:iron complex outermembrane recepter protein
MKIHYQRLIWALGITGIAVPGTGYAQQAAAPSESLTEIVVTAEKREEKLQDVPVAVTVVSAAQLASQHVYNIADLARTTPSLEIVQAFGGPGGGGQIRGIGTQSFTRSAEGAVGVVVDGVPQGNVNINNIFDMQRVEVLKGPQGTLFGLTSSAGVINMVTVAPDPTKFETKVHLDYSDNGRFGSEFGEETVRAVVNAPFSDTSAIRVSVTDDRTKGVQVNDFTHDDNIATDWSVRARYRYKPSDVFEMNLIADYDRRGQNYSDPQFTYVYANPGLTAQLAACGITPGFDNQARCGNNANDTNTRNYGTSAQFDFSTDSVTFTSITGLRKFQQAPGDTDIMGLAYQFLQIFTEGATASGRQFSQELRVASRGTQTVDYLAGLFYSDYLALTSYMPGGGFNLGTFDAGPGFTRFAPPSATSTRTTNKSDAAFGQLTYHVTDALGLIAGLRYTHQSVSDFQSVNAYAPTDPTSPATYGALTKDNVSGRLGLQYKFDPDLTGYFTVVRGYKGPQVTPAAEGTPATVIGAEIPTAFELGLKGAFWERRIGFDGDLFYSRVHDYQGQRCSINPVGILACFGESVPSVTTKGMELNLYGQVAPGLTINAGYIYDIAEYPSGYTGYDPNNLTGINNTTDLSHLQLVGVPKSKLSLSAMYEVPLGAVTGFASADTVYKSAIRFGPTADPRFVYSGHFNTGLRLGVRSTEDRWSAALFVRNLSNDHEPVTMFGGPSFTPPGADPTAPNGYINGVSGWVTENALRQVGLSLDARF